MGESNIWQLECKKLGFLPEIRRYDEGTRTSHDAATQLGCDVAHIAKSIIFRSEKGPILVITSGVNRVDRKKKMKAILGYKVSLSDAEYVHKSTGYAIGGVPPFAHQKKLISFMDEDLLQHSLVWGAAGTTQTVFSITPNELLRLSGATLADVKQG